jgi:molecular chaperone GrpE
MAEKKKQTMKETEREVQEKVSTPETTEDTSKEMEEKKEVSSRKKRSAKKSKQSKEKELQEKVDEINDKYLRLYSDFDNYRKRTIKERIELSKTASEEIIIELLPILDDFERANKSNETSKDCEAIKDGINLIYSKFKSTLEKNGLKPIEAIGKEFDTDYHEAITQIPAPSDDLKGKIVDEIEKGYQLNDKVIRFSKVVIGQ